MLDKMLKIKYLKTKTNVKGKVYYDTNYSNDYNEIFKNNSFQLDRQTISINKLDFQLDSKLFSETNYKDKINKFFQDNSLYNDTFSY